MVGNQHHRKLGVLLENFDAIIAEGIQYTGTQVKALSRANIIFDGMISS